MNRRFIHAVIVNALLVTASLFYLLSPTVYAYFSEVGMSYSRVPKWFATTAPARITARIFDSYNANAPRAVRFRKQLSCSLEEGDDREAPGCMHELRAGRSVYGPPSLKIPSGQYVARFDFSATDRCSGGDAQLEVRTRGRFGKVLASYSGSIRPDQRIELPFRLRLMDAALGTLEFSAAGASECVLLSGITWSRS